MTERCSQARSRTLTAAALCAALLVSPGFADIFRLRNGGIVEGQLVKQDGESYRVRTPVGTVVLPRDSVEAVEKAPSVFDEYDARVAKLEPSAAANVALAKWCQGQNLKAEAKRHYQAALKLDPEDAEARTALGYVKVGAVWVRSTSRKPAASQPADNDPQAPEQVDEAKLAEEIQRTWQKRIRAIRQQQLESSIERLAEQGRAIIEEIDDPLAILPLSRELSVGKPSTRALLVEMLARFPQDEATMNLAMIALLDPLDGIRRDALTALAKRDDDRACAIFRQALTSQHEDLIRRGAFALGVLKSRNSIPDLIPALRVDVLRWVRPEPQFYLGMNRVFNAPVTAYPVVAAGVVAYRPQIGVLPSGASLGAGPTAAPRLQQVTVFRTEVQEALKQITGQNFGFDAAAWRRWYEENES